MVENDNNLKQRTTTTRFYGEEWGCVEIWGVAVGLRRVVCDAKLIWELLGCPKKSKKFEKIKTKLSAPVFDDKTN